MRILSASVTHALGLLQQATDDPTIARVAPLLSNAARIVERRPEKLLSFVPTEGAPPRPSLPLLPSSPPPQGVLPQPSSLPPQAVPPQQDEPPLRDEPPPRGDATAADMFPPELAECGIDGTKILATLLVDGFPDKADWEKIGLDVVATFADEGDEECTDDEINQFRIAVSDFIHCTGWDKHFEDEDALVQLEKDLEEKCGPFDDVLEDDLEDVVDKECEAVILGHNPLGDLLHDIYLNVGKDCGCIQTFGESVPACLISDEEFVVPLSFFSKSACLIGKACDEVEAECAFELEALDNCLPPLHDAAPGGIDWWTGCLETVYRCSIDGTGLFYLPLGLTDGELPDTCLRVYEEEGSDTSVPLRFADSRVSCDVFLTPEVVATLPLEGGVREQLKEQVESSDEDVRVAFPGIAFLAVVLVAAMVFLATKRIILDNKRDDTDDPSKKPFAHALVTPYSG